MKVIVFVIVVVVTAALFVLANLVHQLSVDIRRLRRRIEEAGVQLNDLDDDGYDDPDW